ncbi:UDP-N-acetylmuramoyl-tripeptide--D-alanyl-D-alanine ligase [Echinicola strongylocentroti]|uniref:UDP-N-acetylmuramoyl-tripeptide--D-alanyl-D-alanine ligase n=1 Tax=Echinicola strongylocentroti TaxID=1795355 RepID=A0A2Z4IKZ0_9BACT|nr:UDP-N-acetylmuramoyl-tripeptide--D-alanyl-D-alanine ligase [Echinicola strongylocentroti]AWW31399.1 UDP-N-acetylmuramoyl-tripeptide--D-alanyl-D-alanine ligase [Echinicola strongylocentroti]
MSSIASLYTVYKKSTGVSTDTRKIGEGNLFFALKGPNFNANSFAAKALEMGASAVVIDEKEFAVEGDERYVLVEDVLAALQALANYHRKQLDIPFLAITGSNGKTTTKELVNAVLSKKYKTYATEGNLNNHIGVPLTLLAMDEQTELAIVEMGANKIGDIAELCEIAEPTHGLITNIGRAHLEGFGGFEGVLRAKTELYQFLISHQGKIFVNSQNQVLANMMKRMDDPVTYPAKGDFYHCELVEANPFVTFKTADGKVYDTKMLGGYNFENIATALTVGKFFGVEEEVAIAAVCQYTPGNMRSQLIERRSNLIVLDAYNANPSSMEQAIRTFGKMTGKPHKMVILGDMYELGDNTVEEHKKLGEWVSEYDIDKVCFTGELTQNALLKAPRALYFPDPFSLRNWLADSKLEDHLILIKGSRGMKLEGLVEFI